MNHKLPKHLLEVKSSDKFTVIDLRKITHVTIYEDGKDFIVEAYFLGGHGYQLSSSLQYEKSSELYESIKNRLKEI